MLEEENIPRGEWKLAKVTEIVKSNDNEVRTVKLRMGGGRECNRPVNRVYSLEIRQEAKTIKEVTEGSLGTQISKEKAIASSPHACKRFPNSKLSHCFIC